jgi:hypothetical protein
MEFHVRSLSTPERIGILPGSFNPPTLAHCALVHAAGFYVDEVLCVLPRAFPHKEYFGATLKERLQMLDQSDLFPIYSIAISQSGLFVDIARECREHYGRSTKCILSAAPMRLSVSSSRTVPRRVNGKSRSKPRTGVLLE